MSLYQRLIDQGVIDYGGSIFGRFETIDLHTAGEPLRVILKGYPEIQGHDVLSRRRYCQDELDHLRTALMLEPRGHSDMYGCLLVPPDNPDSDFGVLFLHNAGYSTMCGHAIIALTYLMHARGWKDASGDKMELRIDAPCGTIHSWIERDHLDHPTVSFRGVPSFVVGTRAEVAVPPWGRVQYVLAYGGAFYAYVDADELGLDISLENSIEIKETGMLIKQAVMAKDDRISHPFESDLSFLYGTIFTSKRSPAGCDSYNVCIFADGELDRCPTGSGLSGRMAIEHLVHGLPLQKSFSVESITGGKYVGFAESELNFGSHAAVVPQISGQAFITGEHTFILEENDVLGRGFRIR